MISFLYRGCYTTWLAKLIRTRIFMFKTLYIVLGSVELIGQQGRVTGEEALSTEKLPL